MRRSRVDRYECGEGHLCSIWPAVIAGAAALAGGALSANASKSAASTGAQASRDAAEIQAQSAREALALQDEMYRQQQAIYQDQARMYAPAYGAGTNALAQLSSLYGVYQPEQFSPYQPGSIAAQGGNALSSISPSTYSSGSQSAGYLPNQQDISAQDILALNAMSGGLEDDNISLESVFGRIGLQPGQQQYTDSGFSTGGNSASLQPQYPQAPQYQPTGMAGFYSGPEAQLANNALSVAMDRGTRSLDRSAAASGGVLSGAQAKALSDYAQGTNAQYMQSAYGDYANRLAALAGIGQTATTGMAGVGNSQANAAGNYAANAGNLMQGSGNAAATGMLNASDSMMAGQMGSANSWGNALNQIGNIAGQYAYGQGWGQPSSSSAWSGQGNPFDWAYG